MSDATPIAATDSSAKSTEQKHDLMFVDETKPTSSEDKPSGAEGQTTTEGQPLNGEIEQGGTEETAATAEAGAGGAVDSADADTATAEGGNGTSTTDKKPRRKSTGVPEHKTKKTLKHKKSVKEFHTDAKSGELYLCRLKGHPAWPAIIADDDMLPEVIESRRPITTVGRDGTWKRPEYAPGGKRHHERTFAVLFLHTNEFAWVAAGDLQPLSVEECKNVSEKSKSKALIAAFEEASKGHDLSYYKELLSDHADALAEEEIAQAEREAEKSRKAEKKTKRKSDAAVVVDDEMDVDDDATETKPKGKKRKKEAGEDDGNEKPAKTPKTTKLKLSNPKTPATGEKSSKKKDAGAKGTNKKKTPAKMADSDDAETPVPEKELTAEEKHAKREQEVKYCRHKLQRGLLTRDNVPSDEEVKTMSTYLKKLEDYPELEASIIRATKIHKVLKAMIKLQTIPRDEEYGFKKRSHELLAKWNKVLAADDKPEPEADYKDLAPVTNGEAKSTENDGSDNKEGDSKDYEKAVKSEEKAIRAADNGEDEAAAAAEPKENLDGASTGTRVEGAKEDDIDKPARLVDEKKSDEPDVSKTPAEEYKPPVESAEPSTDPTATS